MLTPKLGKRWDVTQISIQPDIGYACDQLFLVKKTLLFPVSFSQSCDYLCMNQSEHQRYRDHISLL